MVLMNAVEDFLSKGKLLSPEVLEEAGSLETEDMERVIESSGLVITKKDIQEVKIPKPEIVHHGEGGGGEVHVSELTEFYLDRFEFLKEEVKNRLDDANISSINNLSSGKSSVIGMVRKVDDGNVLIEDKTGELTLKTDEKFLEDEVIGVKGEVIVNEDVIMSPSKIVNPDVPIRRNVPTLDQEFTALFVSEVNDDVKERLRDIEPDYVFCASEQKGDKEAVHISEEPDELSDIDPVRCDLGDLHILLHDGEALVKAERELEADTKEALVALLKKRHLDPLEMHSLQDRYLIRKVPDILHVKGNESVMTNYKGVTLLSTTDDTAFLVNLKTREVDEIEI
ncbi:MAG: hypothetical protein ACLFQ8_03575 [Candidatus Aenigmatarchaeota archaeon]